MATLTANGLTIGEVLKRTAPDGNMAKIAEVIEKRNDILQDAVWVMGNDHWSNKTTRRSSLPGGTWRSLNTGVTASKSATVEVVDTIGMLDDIAKNDVEVINSFANPKQARSDEIKAFFSGLGQEMASTIFYGNAAIDPEEFTGLAPRLNDYGTEIANVMTAGGSGGDTSSIYVVDWGVDSVFMAYPKNSKGGMEHKNLGVQLVSDSGTGAQPTGEFLAYVDYFTWKAGLVVRNFKSIGRIANIEIGGVTDIFDEDDLITLMNRMTGGPGTRIYCGTEVMTQMEIRQKDKHNMHYTLADGIAPGPVMMFKGVPVRKCEQILDTEDAVGT